MLLFPAIDLYEGKAVRLYKGDYGKMTVYSDDPVSVARDFVKCGMKNVHIVDLEGARMGGTPNMATITKIKEDTGLFCEVGGGIRNMLTVQQYMKEGIDRVIIGTSAVTDEKFLKDAANEYQEHISVGVDIRDGYVAIRGWEQKTEQEAFGFVDKIVSYGIGHVICTDISRDGAMVGTNRQLYKELAKRFNVRITASGGISSIEDIKALRKLNLYAAIIGKAYYNGAIELRAAQEVAE